MSNSEQKKPVAEAENCEKGFVAALKRLLKRFWLTRQMCRALYSVRKNGLRYTVRRVKMKLRMRRAAKKSIYTAEVLEKQRKTKFTNDIKISILVPLYNTPKNYLKDMIESVTGQTYANWQLCLADGSDEQHADLEASVR